MRLLKPGSLPADLRQLFRYITPRRKWQLGLLLCLMLMSALSEVVSLGAILPFLTALSNADDLLNSPRLQPIFSALAITSSANLVTWLAIVFILIAIISNVLRILTLHTQAHLAARISSDLSCLLYERTLRQPYDFHTRHNSSDLVNILISDSNYVSLTVNAFLFTVTNSFVIAALICGLFLINAPVALSATVFLGTAYLFLYRWRKNKLLQNSQAITQHGQQQIKSVQESIGGVREVILSGCHNFFQSTYSQSNRIYRQAVASNQTTSSTPRYGIEMIAMIAIALLALTLGRDGDFSQAIPVLGSLALGANRLLPALQQSFSAVAQAQGYRSSLQRVLIALQRPINPLQTQIAPHPLNLHQELRFENVGFRYSPDGDWVLHNLSLVIPARSTIGFVGTTGSGKSTTADLILGLLHPEEGTIFVDGLPLVGQRLRAWQSTIAHVPQRIFLSDATIADNIAFGIPPELIDRQRVKMAAQLAQLSKFIETLPERYNTVVGERGVRLSGGQQQRVGIARALYRNAKVIVFDEATSALDNATEKEVMGAIENLSQELTIILIAHRLTTVEKCDRIFEFQQGQVVASGTYSELLARSPSFQRMATS